LPSEARGADKNVFSKVKMVIFDEVDAVFNVDSNVIEINKFIINHLKVALGVKP
jgi:hypothetical protein